MNFTNCNFHNLKSTISGAIYATLNSKVFVNSSVFHDCTSDDEGGALSIYESEVEVDGSNFTSFSGGCLVGQRANSMQIHGSRFSNGDSNKSGGAIRCDDCSYIDVLRCFL
jgi:predicted outer membrane repeat protein